MKAIICTHYGPPEVLQLAQIKKPTPKDNEVLIKIYATSVTAADYRIRGFNFPFGFSLLTRLFFGISGPRNPVLGVNLSGRVEAVGKEINEFKVRDLVFASNSMRFGAYAEYICLAEKSTLALKPDNLSFEEAAAMPFGGLTALSFLRGKGKIQPGEKVLVNGASGAVGTAAIQLAKYFGAEVTAVCSTSNKELVRSLGADDVIDYTEQDFIKSEKTFDIILDAVGNIPFSRCKHLLNRGGRHLAVVSGLFAYVQVLWTSFVGNKKTIAGVANETKHDLIFLKELVQTGKLKTVIDRSYPLEKIVDAHRYAEQGHKRGNVVITV